MYTTVRAKVMMGFLDYAWTSITGNCCCFPEQRDWATVMWLQLLLDCLFYSWLLSPLFKEPASLGASSSSPVSHFYILLAEPPLSSSPALKKRQGDIVLSFPVSQRWVGSGPGNGCYHSQQHVFLTNRGKKASGKGGVLLWTWHERAGNMRRNDTWVLPSGCSLYQHHQKEKEWEGTLCQNRVEASKCSLQKMGQTSKQTNKQAKLGQGHL